MTFAVDRDADYRASGVRYDSAGSSFECSTAAGAVEVRVPLPGLFNVYNALAAIAAGGALGVPLDVAAAASQDAGRVPGRFEPIDEGQGFRVLVDYAHTPDSLENVLVSARELLEQAGGEGRLIVRLRRRRRPRPREAAADGRGRAAPRRPHDRDLGQPALGGAGRDHRRDRRGRRGCRSGGRGLRRWRSRPIAAPRSSARWSWRGPGDIVLIAGKGHEQGQEFEGGRKIPFDDRDVAREALRGLAAGSHASRPPVIGFSPTEIARAAGATLLAGAPEPAGAADAPARAVVDSRQVGPGDLFVGLAGERADGGAFAAAAIEAGAWGVIVTGAHTASACAAAARRGRARVRGRRPAGGARRARAGVGRPAREQGGCRVVGITGSTGKTSTKDILLALAGPPFGGRVHANRENFNTEIGLPLTVLEAERGHRADRARDGDAGPGADPRAGADRAPRGRRDHERRPGAPGAGRDGRGRRRGEGRADRGAARRARSASSRRRRRRCGRTCAARCGRSRSRRPGARAWRRSPARPPTCARWRSSRTAMGCGSRSRPGAERAHASSSTSRRRTTSSNALAAIGALHALGVPLNALVEGARTCGSRACAERSSSSRTALSSSTIATTPTRYRCAPRSTTSPPWPIAAERGAWWRCWARWASWGPQAPEFHREIGAHAAEAGVEVAGRGGRPRRRLRAGLRPPGARGAGRGAGGRRWPPASCGEGDVVLVKGSRGGRAGAGRARRSTGARERHRPDGRDPDRGARLAADLHLPRARSSSSSCGRGSSASTSARRARTSTT